MAERVGLSAERARLRERLGRVGLWSFQLDRLTAAAERQLAGEIDRLGFGSLWVAEGTASKEALTHSGVLLAATERLVIGTGIASIWARDATAMASAARYLAEAFGGRFVLGMGVSHPGALARRGHRYERPLTVMRRYLQQMDEAVLTAPAPPSGPCRVVAALRPRMLELAAELTHGAHTYFVPPIHTARARAILGPDPVLIPEQAIVMERDAATARAIARQYTSHYLARENYRGNLGALGFTGDDLDGAGSERLVESLVAWGDAAQIVARVAEHHAAGADHVVLQILTPSGAISPEDIRALAELDGLFSQLGIAQLPAGKTQGREGRTAGRR